MTATDFDVVILGGGPVGCTLACLLNDMGVTNMVIDRDAQPYELPRAIVMDDEILRALHDHGMGEWLGEHTSLLERADFLGPDGSVVTGMDIPPAGLQGVPPVVVHFQPELDTMLRARAEAGGSQVLWGRTVRDMTDNGDHVVTVLDDGTEVTSRWFVGADGASSWTRRHIGLTLEDLRFDQEWLVVDIELNEDGVPELPLGVRQYCNTDGPCTYVKGVRRFRRWEFQVQPHDDSTEMNTEAGLWRILAPWVQPSQARIIRSAVYRFHAVVAPQMQKGNVFLAGDSAHQTPPFAGQGLNSGQRDAINLAWKFSYVVRGLATPRILDTYTPERMPHVKSTVAHAVDMGRLIDQLAGRESHGVGVDSGYGGARPAPCIESGLIVGGDDRVGHQFWYHPEVSAAVRANGASFAVVTDSPVDLPAELEALGAHNVVAPQATGGSYAVVVRPDRYVAAVARDAADLADIAVRLFSLV